MRRSVLSLLVALMSSSLTIALAADSVWQGTVSDQKADNRRWEAEARQQQSEYFRIAQQKLLQEKNPEEAEEYFRKALNVYYVQWEFRQERRSLTRAGESATVDMPTGRQVRVLLQTPINEQAQRQLNRIVEKRQTDAADELLRQARQKETEKRFAEAFELYSQVLNAELPEKVRPRYQDEARKRSEAILTKAEQELNRIGTAAGGRDAIKTVTEMLARFEVEYGALAEHPRVRAALLALTALPEVGKILRAQHAQKELERALERLGAGRLGDAYDMLKVVAEQYADTPAGKNASEELHKLYADPTLAQVIRDQQAERECVKLLNLAQNYARNGLLDRAGEMYRDIITRFPGTRWANEASRVLALLEEGKTTP